MFETVWQDLRHSVRTLRRSPGFAALVVVTLGLVIGATTTIFGLASSLLLRPPDGDEPDRLVRVFYGRGSNMLYPDYVEHRDSSRTMDLAAFDDQRVSVSIDGSSEPAFAELLTANYFRVAGVRAALGRVFEEEDATSNAAPVAVLSNAYWRQRFDGSLSAVGWSIVINGVDFRIVGVAPPEFSGAYGFMAANLWVPITTDPLLRPGTNQLMDRERARGVQVLGRLRPGVRLEQARTDAELIAGDLQERFPSAATAGVSVQPASMLPGDIGRQATLFLGLLLGIAILLLIAACANVANLLLARNAGASRDVALRQAIGATRGRLVRQLLTETFLLATVATAGALGLTWVAMRALSESRKILHRRDVLTCPSAAAG
jgi:predicted permease